MNMTNDLYNLLLIVKLTEQNCKKYRVKLEPKKTKLHCYSKQCNDFLVKHAISTNPTTLNNVKIVATIEVEHVGVVRNIGGNIKISKNQEPIPPVYIAKSTKILKRMLKISPV